MTKRWWSLVPAVLVLAGALVLGGGVGAQNSAVPENDLGMVAEVHTGSCANLADNVAFPLGALVRAGAATLGSTSASDSGFGSLGNGLVGASDTTPVWTTNKTIEIAPARLFDGSQPYALVVGDQGSNGIVAACGDLGGVVANGQITIALLPINSTTSGLLSGIAVFSAPHATAVSTVMATETAEARADANRTEVTVYIFRLAPPTTPTAVIASPQPASPTAAPTIAPTETATMAATATAASTGTAEPTVSGTGTAVPTSVSTATIEPITTPTTAP